MTGVDVLDVRGLGDLVILLLVIVVCASALRVRGEDVLLDLLVDLLELLDETLLLCLRDGERVTESADGDVVDGISRATAVATVVSVSPDDRGDETVVLSRGRVTLHDVLYRVVDAPGLDVALGGVHCDLCCVHDGDEELESQSSLQFYFIYRLASEKKVLSFVLSFFCLFLMLRGFC